MNVQSTICRPGIEHERKWWQAGFSLVAGLDEAGRGAWAGPVVAAAVILPMCEEIPEALAEVNDSKLLSPAQRERLFPIIIRHAICYGIGAMPAQEIDRIGIVPATRAAMLAAVKSLCPQPHALLIDSLKLPECDYPQQVIVRGDRLSLSIAAASILAKVTRDRWMQQAEAAFAGYGFAQHKGYGTREHIHALSTLGPCELHRCSYAPVAQIVREWHK